MTPSYHARQELSQVQITEYESAARAQEAGILRIRRALTNLANGGQISKTGQVQGHYRRPINTYRYGVISHV